MSDDGITPFAFYSAGDSWLWSRFAVGWRYIGLQAQHDLVRRMYGR